MAHDDIILYVVLAVVLCHVSLYIMFNLSVHIQVYGDEQCCAILDKVVQYSVAFVTSCK